MGRKPCSWGKTPKVEFPAPLAAGARLADFADELGAARGVINAVTVGWKCLSR